MTFDKNLINQKLLPVDFKKSIFTPERLRYPELQQFLQEIESSDTAKLYHPFFEYKKNAGFYRLIFVFFGFLFLVLGFLIYAKSPNWIIHHVVWDGNLIKHMVIGLSLLLSTVSFMVACRMKVEREALSFLVHKAKKQLHRKYRLKCACYCFFDNFPFSPEYRKRDLVRQAYLDALDKVYHAKDEYLIILQRVALTPDISHAAKEKLFDQTLMKFQDFVNVVVLKFGHS